MCGFSLDVQSPAWGKGISNSLNGQGRGLEGEGCGAEEKEGEHRPPSLLQHRGPFFRVGDLIAGLRYRQGSKERFLTWPSSQYTFAECQL